MIWDEGCESSKLPRRPGAWCPHQRAAATLGGGAARDTSSEHYCTRRAGAVRSAAGVELPGEIQGHCVRVGVRYNNAK